MKRLSIQRAQEQMYLDVLRSRLAEPVPDVEQAHKIAKRAARLAGRGLRSLRGQKSSQGPFSAPQSTFLGIMTGDPFHDVFGYPRRPDVEEYEIYFARNGRTEEDAEPDGCSQTLAGAICGAKQWISDERAEEYVIECHHLPLLRVTKSGLQPIERHPDGHAAVMDGIGQLLTWEQILRPLFVDGPLNEEEESPDSEAPLSDPYPLADDDESEEP